MLESLSRILMSLKNILCRRVQVGVHSPACVDLSAPHPWRRCSCGWLGTWALPSSLPSSLSCTWRSSAGAAWRAGDIFALEGPRRARCSGLSGWKGGSWRRCGSAHPACAPWFLSPAAPRWCRRWGWIPRPEDRTHGLSDLQAPSAEPPALSPPASSCQENTTF